MPVDGPRRVVALAVRPEVDGGRYPDSVPIFEFMLLPALINYATLPGGNLLMTQKRYPLLAGLYGTLLVLQLIAAGGVASASGSAGISGAAGLSCGSSPSVSSTLGADPK